LSDVVKVYRQREVLHIQELEVRRSEILCIIGPSGAGKSTLLRLLNFLDPPTSGEIAFNGRLVNGAIPLEIKRQVTTVFQRPILFRATTHQNVVYGLRIRGERDGDERARRAIDQVGLGEFAQAPARKLSGGEAQRVALARALVIEPDVLLLDEPTANLDPYNIGLIERIITALNREQGTTIVLVTHNVFQARRLGHRVALLLEGQVVETADVEQFFNEPRDPRTAAFVRGEMIY
jgi:tungstate transport system ATP-binding protein